MTPDLPDSIKNRTWTTKEVLLIAFILVLGAMEYVRYNQNQQRVDALEIRHAQDIKMLEAELRAELEKEESERKQSVSAIWQRMGSLMEN